jgi:hypothetical protein
MALQKYMSPTCAFVDILFYTRRRYTIALTKNANIAKDGFNKPEINKISNCSNIGEKQIILILHSLVHNIVIGSTSNPVQTIS